jgi:phosphoribosylglycinamide formyltransferase 1
MNELLGNSFFRSLVHSVVADRECAALSKARAHGVSTELFAEPNRHQFCARLDQYLQEVSADYVISHYMKTYTPKFQRAYRDRIMNLHLALLPAFKGYDGFGEAVRYGVRFVGSTIELVHGRMDEGKIVMQAATPLDRTIPLAAVRHRVFVQQCKSLLQVCRWLVEGRIKVSGRHVEVVGARFDNCEFSPALDDHDAIALAPRLDLDSIDPHGEP